MTPRRWSRWRDRQSLWRDRPFLLTWSSSAISQVGDRVSEVAVPLIAVTVLDASAGQVAWLTALAWAPNLLGVLLGAWVDGRPGKRRLIIGCDLFRAVVLLTLPAVYLWGTLTTAHLYAAVLLCGVAGVLADCAFTPLFALLVPRSSYVDANSKFSAARSASFIAGPALGGGIVQALTAPVAVAVDAVSFLASALLLRPVRVTEPVPERRDRQGVWHGAREGLVFVLRHPVLRASLGCTTTINFFTFLTGSGMVVLFADRELQLPPGVIGLTLGIGATGSLVGALVAPWVSRRIGLGRAVAVGTVLFPAPFALTVVADGPTWARAGVLGVAQFLIGLGVMLFDVNLNSLMTAVVPDGVRSLVTGAYSTVNYGVRPLGALTGGALATGVGLRPTFVVAAVGGMLALLWLLPSPIPGIRSLEPEHLPEPVPA
ncbi:MFS transporter [Streptomyces sp. NBC_00663]|uniref:MFS transporter n=1 Tax=Streptomyces sp. NBC_00663 TaxID=2975801 RepID=UPI002E2F72F7|nr:MFS transporter [Streptomyces sp. NBC_00663]